MRIAVIGATGHTGTHVIEHGLGRGHHMTALARRPEAVARRDENLTVARADALDGEQLSEAMPVAKPSSRHSGSGPPGRQPSSTPRASPMH